MKVLQVILISVFCACAYASGHDGVHSAVCKVDAGTGSADEPIEGTITIEKTDDITVTFHLALSGFDTEDNDYLHGFHIHDSGDTNDACRASGGHYNPFGRDHGGPDDENDRRHVGDLGNIHEDEDGKVNQVVVDDSGLVHLEGEYSIIGRAIVIHEREDDLGRGGADDSLTTGSAGSRLACCVIEEAEPDISAAISLRALGNSAFFLLVALTVIMGARL